MSTEASSRVSMLAAGEHQHDLPVSEEMRLGRQGLREAGGANGASRRPDFLDFVAKSVTARSSSSSLMRMTSVYSGGAGFPR